MIFFSDDDVLATELIRALKSHARVCHDNGSFLPECLADLYAALSGPERSEPLVDGPTRDPGSMSLFTYREAADRLGVSEKTLRRYAARGDLKTVALGRARRIRPDDLDRFIEAL